MIHYFTYELLKKHLKNDTVLILGDTILDIDPERQGGKLKDYLKDKYGVEAKDLDKYNPSDFHKIDLGKTISKTKLEAIGRYSLIADFGTLEHVKNLHKALINVLEFTLPGGLMIHANPKVNNFPNHAREDEKPCWKFTQEFWQEYAKLAKLEVIETSEQAAYHNTQTGVEVYAVLKKKGRGRKITADEFTGLASKYLG